MVNLIPVGRKTALTVKRKSLNKFVRRFAMDIKTQYDVAGLVSTAKANLCKFVAKIVICVFLLVLSILAIILYGS